MDGAFFGIVVVVVVVVVCVRFSFCFLVRPSHVLIGWPIGCQGNRQKRKKLQRETRNRNKEQRSTFFFLLPAAAIELDCRYPPIIAFLRFSQVRFRVEMGRGKKNRKKRRSRSAVYPSDAKKEQKIIMTIIKKWKHKVEGRLVICLFIFTKKKKQNKTKQKKSTFLKNIFFAGQGLFRSSFQVVSRSSFRIMSRRGRKKKDILIDPISLLEQNGSFFFT